MNFSNVQALWGILLLVPCFIIYMVAIKRNYNISSRFFRAGLSDSAKSKYLFRSITSMILSMLFIIFASTGFSGPSYGYEYEYHTGGVSEIALLIDVSKSMLATDQLPSRLETAKNLVRNVIQNTQNTNYSLTIVKGSASTLVPMTEDFSALIDALEYANPYAITSTSTDLGSGISEAVDTFTDKNARRALVILSDGEDRQDKAIAKAFEARKNGITVFAVLLGGKEKIFVMDEDGSVISGPDGQPAFTITSTETMEKLASNGRVHSADSAFEEICSFADFDNGKIGEHKSSEKKPRNISGLFFILATLITIIKLFISPSGVLA